MSFSAKYPEKFLDGVALVQFRKNLAARLSGVWEARSESQLEEDIAKKLDGFMEAPREQLENELARIIEERGVQAPKVVAFFAMPVTEEERRSGELLEAIGKEQDRILHGPPDTSDNSEFRRGWDDSPDFP